MSSGEDLVEDDPPDGGLEKMRWLRLFVSRSVFGLVSFTLGRDGSGRPHLDQRSQIDLTEIEGELRLFEGGVQAPGGSTVGGRIRTLRPAIDLRHVVGAENHIERRCDRRIAARRREQVLRREQDLLRLGHGFPAEGHVNRHLVAIEVGVEGGTDERMQLHGGALDQDGQERLNSEAVKRGRTVEQHRAVLDELVEDVPDLRARSLHDALRALDVVRQALGDERMHDERLEQLERHLLGQPALMQLQLRAHHDHRAARVVDALAEQVLRKRPCLPLSMSLRLFSLWLPLPLTARPAGRYQ